MFSGVLWGIKHPEKILRHVTSNFDVYFQLTLIKFGIKNDRFYIEIIML